MAEETNVTTGVTSDAQTLDDLTALQSASPTLDGEVQSDINVATSGAGAEPDSPSQMDSNSATLTDGAPLTTGDVAAEEFSVNEATSAGTGDTLLVDPQATSDGSGTSAVDGAAGAATDILASGEMEPSSDGAASTPLGSSADGIAPIDQTSDAAAAGEAGSEASSSVGSSSTAGTGSVADASSVLDASSAAAGSDEIIPGATETPVDPGTGGSAAPIDGSTSGPGDPAPALSLAKSISGIVGADGTSLVSVGRAGDVVTFSVTVSNTGNTLLQDVTVIDPLAGSALVTGLSLTPGQVETFTFSYTVTSNDIDTLGGGDNRLDSVATASSDLTESVTAEAGVPINPVSGSPLAENASLEVTSAETVSGQLRATDPDSTVLTFSLVGNPPAGLTLSPDGSYSYTPENFAELDGNEVRTLTIPYVVTDEDGNTSTATFTINITGTNDVASLTSDTKALSETDAVLETSGTLSLTDEDATDATVVAQTGTAGSYGTFSIGTNGAWTYKTSDAVNQLNAGESVTETFTVATSDGGSSTVTVTITGTNDVASLTSDTKALSETDAVLETSGTLSLTDEDATDATVVAQTGTAGSYGTFSIGTNGAWTYKTSDAVNQLNAGESVTETFTVATSDGGSSTVTVTITGTNDVASLTSDTKALSETDAVLETSGTLSLTDEDATDATVVAQTGTAGSYGTFSIGTNGAWTYKTSDAVNQLNAGESVTETFTVATSDGGSSTVTVTITGTNDVASLTSDTKALSETDAVLETSGTLSLTDEDATDATVVAQTGTAGSYGTFSIGTNGAWTYKTSDAVNQLNAGESVTETFTVATSDGGSSTVTVTITGTNDVASLTSDTKALSETDAVLETSGTLSLTDEDATDATVVAQTGTAGSYGTFSIGTNGAWTYKTSDAVNQLNAGESVTETFTVATSDGGSSTVTVTITGTNDVASLTSDTKALSETDAVLETSGTLSLTDEDATDATVVAQTGTAGSYGTFSIGTNGAWTYKTSDAVNQLNAGESVTETFTVATSDGGSSTVTVTITGTNDVASLTSDTKALSETDAVLETSGTLSLTDEDATDATVVAQTGTAGSYGTFSIGTNGAWTYKTSDAVNQLNAGESVTETFTVATSDGGSSTVTVTITGTNDVASLTSDTKALSETDAVLETSGTLSLTDEDATDATVVAQTGTAGSYGTFSIGTNGAWTYKTSDAVNQLNAGESVTETFTVATSDGGSSTVTVTINGANDPATISGTVTGSVTEDAAQTTATGTLTSTDPDNAANSFTASSGSGSYGSFVITSGGVWTYTLNNANGTVNALNAGGTLTDSFTVTSADGTSQTVTVTINGANDPATISGTVTGSVTEDAAQTTATGTLTSTDPDNAANSFTASSGSGSYGSFVITSGGVWTYTLNNANGTVNALNAGGTLTDSFTVTSADGTSQTVTVTINGANDPATISGTVTGSVTEDAAQTTATGTLTSTDPDNAANSFTASSGSGSYGSFVITSGGVWTYTLNNANGTVNALNAGGTLTDSFTVTSADGTSQTVTVTINGANDPATISGTVTGSVTEDAAQTTATGTLTSTDPDNAANSFTASSGSGSYGSFVITSGGVWTYTLNNANGTVNALNAGGTLTDSFTVTSADGTSQTVTVTINGANDPATISGTVTGSVTEDAAQTTATGTLTSTDPDNAANSFTASSGSGSYGSFVITSGGVWTYTLNNANGTVNALNAGGTLTDSFTVTSADGTSQTVTVTINGANDPATISGTVTGSVTEDAAQTTATGTLTSTDPDNAANSFTASSGSGSYGSFVITSGGVWTYTLNNANGTVNALNAGGTLTDSFTVTSADGTSQTVTVTINGANDPATISGTVTGSVTEDAAQTTATGTLTSTDPDNAANSFTASSGSGSYGSFVITSGGVWTYTLNNANGTVNALNAGGTLTDSFTVTSADGTSQTVTVTINGANDPATISGTVTGSVTEDAAQTTATGTLTSTDPDNAANSFTASSGSGSYGSFVITSGGVWTYTLNNANGTVNALNAGGTLTDSFTVTSADGTSQTVTVTINGANDPATISGTVTGSVTEDAAQTTATGTLTSTDPDNAANSFTASSGSGSYGSFVITSGGVWTYTLNNANGTVNALNAGGTLTDSFTVTSADGTSQTVTVTINGANDPATISGTVTGSVTEDAAQTTATGTLTSTDPDNAANSFTASSGSGSYGSFVITSGGVWTYTLNNANGTVNALNAGGTLTDSFTVTSADGTSQTVTVTINGANDPATISGTVTGSVTEDAAQTTATGTLTSTDPDNAANSFTASSGSGSYGSFVITSGGVWTYTLNNANGTVNALNAGGTLTDSFTVTSADGTSQTVTVTINGANDAVNTPPTVSGTATGSVKEDTTLTTSGTIVGSDVDNDTLAYSVSTASGSYGSLSLNGSTGAWTYTLANSGAAGTAVQGLKAGQSVTDTFTVTVSDGKGGSVTQNIVVTVNGTNDAPTIAIQDQQLSNAVGNAATGGLGFSAGGDVGDASGWSVSAMSIVNSGGLTYQGSAISQTFSSGTLTGYVDKDGNGAFSEAADIKVFTITTSAAAKGTYTFNVFAAFDNDQVLSTIGSASAFGAGPTSVQVLASSTGANLAVVAGFTATGATTSDANPWLTSTLTLASVNGSTGGWGVNSNTFVTGHVLRFDLGVVEDLDGSGSYTKPNVTDLPTAASATFNLGKLDTTDKVSVRIRYTDGTEKVEYVTISSSKTDTIYVATSANKFIATVDFLGVSVSGGGTKIALTEMTAATSSSIDKTMTLSASVRDVDGDAATGDGQFTIRVQSGASPFSTITPLALDLNGDGVQYLGLSAGVRHDYMADGYAEQTAWVGPQDGILAELREDGSLKIVFSTTAGETDMEGLAKVYDTNADHIFSVADKAFASFGVWQDKDSDGIFDQGEFVSLDEAGIVSINLATDNRTVLAADGDVLVYGTGSYVRADGSVGQIDDAGFVTSDNRAAVEAGRGDAGSEMVAVDSDHPDAVLAQMDLSALQGGSDGTLEPIDIVWQDQGLGQQGWTGEVLDVYRFDAPASHLQPGSWTLYIDQGNGYEPYAPNAAENAAHQVLLDHAADVKVDFISATGERDEVVAEDVSKIVWGG